MSFFILIISICAVLLGCTESKTGKIPADMVLIPAGEFIMGTDEIDKENKAEAYGIPNTWYIDEHPKSNVYVDSFYIDIYEVTMKKYKKFIEETGYDAPANWTGTNYPPGSSEYSVVFVNLYDAMAYAKWAGKRIPAEREWEKAARGTDGRIYPWGNKFDSSRANISTSMNKKSRPEPVGQFNNGISPYGVYDMIGNVWEWTVDWYEPYSGNTANNKSFGKKFKVLRGFSWYSIGHFPDEIYLDIAAHRSRASYRQEIYPDTRTIDVGFRCVKDEH